VQTKANIFSTHKALRWLLAIFVFCFTWLLAEFIIWLVDPNIGTFPVKGESYCLDHSDYLPFTTPKSLDYHHKEEQGEFDVHYIFNRYGYRGPYPKTIDKKRKRILLLGDSFTLGWGSNWEDCFAGKLQAHLDSNNTELIDAGYHNCCAPDDYYAYMQKEGWSLKPDVICMVLYTDNDRRDMQTQIWAQLDELKAPTRIESMRFYDNYKGEVMRVKYGEVPFTYKIPILKRSRIIIGLTNLFLPKETEKPDGLFKLTRTLQAFKARSIEHHVPILVFLIPGKKIYEAGMDKQEKEWMLFKRTIHNSGFKLVDLKPELTANDYYPIDAHLNKQGNEKAYQLICPVVDSIVGK